MSWTPSARYPIYSRANIGEVFPDPVVPLSATLGIQEQTEPGWRDAFVRFGAFDHDEFDPNRPEIIGVFGGYAYLNVSISRIFGARTPGLTPETVDQQLFGGQIGAPPYRPTATDESSRHSEQIEATVNWILSTDRLPAVAAQKAEMARLREERPNLAELSDGHLISRARELFAAHLRRLFAEHIFTSYCATVPLGVIQQVCAAIGRPQDVLRLVAALGDVESAAPSFDMWQLSRQAPSSQEFQDGFAELLYRHGCRGPNEWEMRSPTWETHPDLARVAIEQMASVPDDESPLARHHRLDSGRTDLRAEIASVVAGDSDTYQLLCAAFRAADIFLPGRERSKTNAIRLVHEVRATLLELGQRMHRRGYLTSPLGFSMLGNNELDEWIADPANWNDEIESREQAYATLAELEPPFVFEGAPPPVTSWPHRDVGPLGIAAPGDVLVGLSGSPGVARGRTAVVLDPAEPKGLTPGAVLVAPITDPAWTPLFVPAAAVVVDVGAPLSHAVIVSRELGIPCVVSVPNASRRIAEGSLVEVNGDTGQVTILETPP